MSETKLIFQKIPKIMSLVGVVGKNRRNTQGNGYNFRGIDDMYNALNEHLSAEGIFFTSEVLSQDREERTSKSGGNLIYSVITMRFTAYAEDGSSVSSVTIGEAMDSGDKSMNKAMSTAYKYALMQIFCIPTEEEKDTENQTHEVTPKQEQKLWINAEKIADLMKALREGSQTASSADEAVKLARTYYAVSKESEAKIREEYKKIGL